MARATRRTSFPRFTARQLLPRVAGALVLALAFAVTLQASIAGAFRSDSPELALRWAPYDAFARAKLAASLVGPGAGEEGRAAAQALARDALQRDPLMPMALRALGLARETGEGAAANSSAELMFAAERLSRRDQPVQLWLVEHYLRRGEMDEVLRHFDIALRTSVASRDAVFPLLAAAARDRRFAAALRGSMAERPIWGLAFMSYLVDQGTDPELFVSLAQSSLGTRDPDELKMIRSLLARLAALERFDLAARVFERYQLGGEGGTAALREGHFESADGFVPFAWQFVEDEHLWGARERVPNREGNVLRLVAVDGYSGEVARQLVQLAPGTYRLNLRFGDVPQEASARPTAGVACAGSAGQRSLLSLRPARAGPAAQLASGQFRVPGGCPFQWVTLAAAASENDDADPPWADDIAIMRGAASR